MSDVKHQLIDQIVFPDIILHEKPSSLNAQQSFDVIRAYIKQNIDYNYAEISSDYDFCMTVRKKILTSKNNLALSRTVDIFNMCPKEYQDYDIVHTFICKNQNKLKKSIDKYCKRLISLINEPVIDCEHCGGRGVTVEFITEKKLKVKNKK